jgi:Domain of unknown function (DUF4831)
MKKELTAVMILLITLAWSCASVPDVYAVNEEQPTSASLYKGVYYCLPKTQMTVSVQVQRTQKGLNAKFSEHASLIGLTYESGDEFSIEKVSFKTTAVADQSKWYFVHIKPSLFKKYELLLEQSAEGIPNASMAAAEDMSVEIGVEVVKIAVDVLGLVSGVPAGAGLGNQVNSDKLLQRNLEQYSLDIKVDPKLKNVPDSVKKLIQEYAKLSSDYNISSHELESATLKLMIESINSRRQTIAEQFIGKSKKSVLTMHFVYDKADYADKDIPLFYFSKEAGVFSISESLTALTDRKQTMLSIPKGFQSEKAPKPVEAFVLHLSKLPFILKGDSVSNFDSHPDKKDRGSFCYRIPAQVNAHCSWKNEFQKDTTLLVAQAGIIKQLPRKAGVFKTKYELKFDPATGALTTIKVNGDTDNAEKIAKAGEAGAEVIDKLKPDEAEQLKKEIELLKLQQELEELKNK